MPPSQRIKTIYLDMDGVLFDFARAAMRVNGAEDQYQQWIESKRWPAESYYFWRAAGIEDADFWAAVNRQGARFWHTLPLYEWAHDLVATCQKYQAIGADLIVLTSDYPCPSPNCAAGKISALRSLFGPDFFDYFIGPHKHKLAAPGAVLIDDQESNLQRFSAAGGGVVPFPAPWNSWGPPNDPVGFVQKRLRELAGNFQS